MWVDANDSGPPTPEQLAPPAADVNGRPHGGLWTSTLVDGTSAWRDAMLELLAGHVPIVKAPRVGADAAARTRLGSADTSGGT